MVGVGSLACLMLISSSLKLRTSDDQGCGASKAGHYTARTDLSMRILCQNGVLQ